jgi:transposase
MSGDRPRHFDIVAQTRRVRSDEEKRAIVVEASQGHRNTSAVARRHGIKPSLLFRWKKQFAVDFVLKAGPVLDPRPAPPSFVPVKALPSPVPKMSAWGPPGSTHQSLIEIEVLGGRKVRVGADIDTGVLKRIIAALETLS